MFLATLSDLHVSDIGGHVTTAINEIPAKIDHVLFMFNWFTVLRK